jgi:pimeloyl-ACP methyl ester carboxylesterase
MAWRYQIPQFLKLGFRVIAPDCIGYGRSVSDFLAVPSSEPNS